MFNNDNVMTLYINLIDNKLINIDTTGTDTARAGERKPVYVSLALWPAAATSS